MKEIIIEVPDNFGKNLKPEEFNYEIKGELIRCECCAIWNAEKGCCERYSVVKDYHDPYFYCADGKRKIESVRGKRSKLVGEVCDKGILWINTETKEQTLENYD